nr:hypothetical protein [Tanacetum cinerariifolium]
MAFKNFMTHRIDGEFNFLPKDPVDDTGADSPSISINTETSKTFVEPFNTTDPSQFAENMVWAECDAIHKRENLKDMEYAKLKAKCNDALEDLEKKPLVNYKQTLASLHYMVEGLEGSEIQLMQQLVKAAIIHGRCSVFEEVASLKEPFDLTKMPGYRSSSKEDYNRAGNDLANVVYPFLIEATSNPYALIEVLLSKIPKSLFPSSSAMKFAPSYFMSKSMPSSSKATNQES